MTEHTNANGTATATASAAAVAGLAREVEALRKAVRATGELHTRVDELARLVAAVGEQLDQPRPRGSTSPRTSAPPETFWRT
jgi:hypothetical protein